MRSRSLLGGKAGWIVIAGWLTCIVVLGTVIAGFLIVGGPTQAREEKADSQRVSDLSTLSRSIRQYYVNKKKLPSKLEDALTESAYVASSSHDPETKASYEYRILDPTHFELCATFQTDQSKATTPMTYSYVEDGEPFWKHRLGRQCFKIAAKN